MKRATLVLCAALVGCTGTPYKLPIPPGYDRAAYRELGYAEGIATGRVVFYFPIGMNETVERATKAAIAKAGGDAITDLTVTQRYSMFPFPGNRIFVRGLVLRKIRPGDAETDYDRGRREERERLERERAQ